MKKSISFVVLCTMLFSMVYGVQISAIKTDPDPANSQAIADKLDYGTAPNVQDFMTAAQKQNMGAGLKRTMRLLETSTPTNRNHVKILFYGQSITSADNGYTYALTDYLQKKYPNAIVEYVNLAINGYTADLLSKTTARDVKSVYPDLVILHDLVFGDKTPYENIIKAIRENTSAEILFFNDHAWLNDYSNAAKDYSYQEGLASKYGIEFCNIRTPWDSYITNTLKPAGKDYKYLVVAKDTQYIHFNSQGQRLAFEILKQYFVYVPSETADSEVCTTLTVGKDIKWSNGKLTATAKGNRIVIVPKTGKKYYAANIVVDGNKPSSYLNAYYSTRVWANDSPYNSGMLLDLTFNKIPYRNVYYSLSLSNLVESGKAFTSFDYIVSSEKKDNLGTGNASTIFTSNDGSITIDPNNFTFSGAIGRADLGKPVTGSMLNWQAVLNGTDIYMDNATKDVVAVSGISNKQHTITLTAINKKELPGIKEIKVYRPKFGTEGTDTIQTAPQKQSISTTYSTSKTSKLYKTSSTKAKVLVKSVGKNKKVTQLSTKLYSKKFYKVKYGNKTGYILAANIKYTKKVVLK